MERNNKAFKIEDYWDLDKLTEEQLKSLSVDLSKFINNKDKEDIKDEI